MAINLPPASNITRFALALAFIKKVPSQGFGYISSPGGVVIALIEIIDANAGRSVHTTACGYPTVATIARWR